MSVVDRPEDDEGRTWRNGPIFSPLPTAIRVLFVIDGRIILDKNPFDFGLGYVLETLRGPITWWARFQVDIAKRDGPSVEGDDLNPLKYPNFKFTNAGFNLDDYDQVWFFGDLPNLNDGADGATTDDDIPGPFALDDGELKLLAEWMDRGGGVFAAGDHSILGASMCSRIPRVRTMRKWTHQQGVPTRDGPARHETLQPNVAGNREGDTVLQPIELVYRPVSGPFPFLRPLMPHPLLCSIRGPIDRFPDHMHEGEVFADDDVQLDRALDIPDYLRPEYPAPAIGQRPRPHVIAYGRTTNKTVNENLLSSGLAGDVTPPFGPKQFGLISTYDGDPIGAGRVVVDSTWHHWFSYNLAGIAANDVPAYEKMQAYYKNVGHWLAKPAQRRSMLISATWGVFTESAPMEFSTRDSPWQIGERVLAILGQTMSPCLLEQLVDPFLDQTTRDAKSAPGGLPESEPSWLGLPADLVNRAVVGGIGSALLDLALDQRNRRARGERPRIDAELIRLRVVDGLSRGQALLRKSVDDAATAFSAIGALLGPVGTPIDVRLSIEARRLLVIAETLQLPDRTDPGLVDSHLTITIRVKLDDYVVAHRILEDIELPSFEARGAVIDLNCDLGEVEVYAGESLSIEVLLGSCTSKEPNSELYRFRDTLRGDASNWIGRAAPGRSQEWRLWYRIEESSQPSY